MKNKQISAPVLVKLNDFIFLFPLGRLYLRLQRKVSKDKDDTDICFNQKRTMFQKSAKEAKVRISEDSTNLIVFRRPVNFLRLGERERFWIWQDCNLPDRRKKHLWRRKCVRRAIFRNIEVRVEGRFVPFNRYIVCNTAIGSLCDLYGVPLLKKLT